MKEFDLIEALAKVADKTIKWKYNESFVIITYNL